MNELTRELEERHGSAQRILGDAHPLTLFIRNALESGDPQLMQVAKAACDGGHGMLHPWTNHREPTREKLMEGYADKPVRCFLQVDGWEHADSGHSNARPDKDGHVLTSGMRYELRNTDFPMRVQIHEASDKETVLTLLSKAHAWLEVRWEALTTPAPLQAPDRQRSDEERDSALAKDRLPSRDRSMQDEPPPPGPKETVDRESRPPTVPVRNVPPVPDGHDQVQALLERVFVLSADMSRLAPEEVARIAAERPKYIDAYLEVADQGIDWYTRFRTALAAAR